MSPVLVSSRSVDFRVSRHVASCTINTCLRAFQSQIVYNEKPMKQKVLRDAGLNPQPLRYEWRAIPITPIPQPPDYAMQVHSYIVLTGMDQITLTMVVQLSHACVFPLTLMS